MSVWSLWLPGRVVAIPSIERERERLMLESWLRCPGDLLIMYTYSRYMELVYMVYEIIGNTSSELNFLN